MDEASLEWLRKVFKASDLAQLRLSSIEMLHNFRSIDLAKGAVYLISPTIHSVKSIMKDLDTHLYALSSVICTKEADVDTLNYMAQVCITAHIHDWVELSLDFKRILFYYLAIESRAFILHGDYSLCDFYGCKEIGTLHKNLKQMVNQACDVLKLLGYLPNVSFYGAASSKNSVAAHAANMIRQKVATERHIWQEDSSEIDMLILDRDCDLVTPFMHSLSYEAICHDILDIERSIVS